MTSASPPSRDGALATTATTGSFDLSGERVVPGRLRRAGTIAGDLLATVAIVLCVPFVLIAVGLPLVLMLQVVLWMAGMR